MFQELYIDPIYIMWDVGWDDGFGCGLGRRFRMWAGTTVSILGRRFRSWDDGLGITQRRWFQRNPHLLKNGPKIEGNPLCRGYIFWALLQKGSTKTPAILLWNSIAIPGPRCSWAKCVGTKSITFWDCGFPALLRRWFQRNPHLCQV